MLRTNSRSNIHLIIAVFLMLLVITFPAYAGDSGSGSTSSHYGLWVVITIVLVFTIIGGGLGYMFILQKHLLQACRDEKHMTVFFQSPAGLPSGTVRSIIALIITSVSLYLAILLFFKVAGDNTEFPQVLSGLLGAVIGFYFGNRSAARPQDENVKEVIKSAREEQERAISEKTAIESESLLGKIKKGITMSKAVLAFMPGDVRKNYEGFIRKMEAGANTVESIAKGGNVVDALSKAGPIFDMFKKDNPVKNVYMKTMKSLTSLLGGSVPAIAVISTVIGVGTKLVGVSYQKWKTRILNAPFNLAEFPLKAVDANTAFRLLRSSRVFREIFIGELERNDRPFMESSLVLLRQEDVESFWAQHKDRFDSREQFEEGLQEFRHAALDLELLDAIDPALFSETGGLKPFMDNIDRINREPESKKALDELVMVAEALQKNGEPVASIFEKVRMEVSDEEE